MDKYISVVNPENVIPERVQELFGVTIVHYAEVIVAKKLNTAGNPR
jgi:hypothetical protein